jgi:hypothetical protein
MTATTTDVNAGWYKTDLKGERSISRRRTTDRLTSKRTG